MACRRRPSRHSNEVTVMLGGRGGPICPSCANSGCRNLAPPRDSSRGSGPDRKATEFVRRAKKKTKFQFFLHYIFAMQDEQFLGGNRNTNKTVVYRCSDRHSIPPKGTRRLSIFGHLLCLPLSSPPLPLASSEEKIQFCQPRAGSMCV